MKERLKLLVKSGIRSVVKAGAKTAPGRYLFEQVLVSATSRTRQIRHKSVDLTFVVPNQLNHFRVETFSTKEPEALEAK